MVLRWIQFCTTYFSKCSTAQAEPEYVVRYVQPRRHEIGGLRGPSAGMWKLPEDSTRDVLRNFPLLIND